MIVFYFIYVIAAWTTLPQPPEAWNGGVGFVSKEMIKAHCPAPASDIKVGLLLGSCPQNP